MTIGKPDVLKALAELRANRPRLAADRMIRGYLQRFGNGANGIGELDPAYYESVWRAAGGTINPEDFYGVTLDVQPVTGRNRNRSPEPATTSTASTRIRTPMTIQLEALLAARAGMPRSKPGGRVDIGAPAQPGDDDAPRQYSSDGWKVR
jgi:hypothetical protein